MIFYLKDTMDTIQTLMITITADILNIAVSIITCGIGNKMHTLIITQTIGNKIKQKVIWNNEKVMVAV